MDADGGIRTSLPQTVDMLLGIKSFHDSELHSRSVHLAFENPQDALPSRSGVGKPNTTITEALETLLPSRNPKEGPLPPLLLAMTLITGKVDAFSFLVLGHVFVANMTGNMVFIAFPLAGAPGFSIPASATALVSFLLGAFGGGRLGFRLGQNRGLLLGVSSGFQALFIGAAATFVFESHGQVSGVFLYGPIVTLGAAIGIQNAAAQGSPYLT